MSRKYYHCEALNNKDATYDDKKIVPTTPEKANLISSLCENGMHKPALDIDLDIEVYPSSQVGHHHLYIDKEMSWEQYCKLLKALVDAGIVEEKYMDASLARGQTLLRPVGTCKPEKASIGKILVENAVLRKKIYEMKKALKETYGAGYVDGSGIIELNDK